MKRKCRFLICLIAIIMIVSALPLAVFAQDDAQSESTVDYVTSGLVSWYDATNRGTTDGVWEDLVGNNDITVEKGYSYSNNSALAFNDKGLYLKDTGVWLPDALRDMMLSEAFTMEFYVEDAALTGASWLGICTSAVRKTNAGENMALFAGTDGKVVLKFHNDGSQRPTTAQNVMPLLNGGALISVTYDTVAQAAVIYINGIEMGRKPVTNQALVDNTYGIALGTITSGSVKKRAGQELTYRSVRFYNRALSATEIKSNAVVDGVYNYVTDGLVSRYDADDRGTTDGVWEDLVGENDIALVNKRTDGKGSIAFTDDGLQLISTWCDLPDGINTVLRGTSFTMEFLMGDIVQGHTYHGIIGASDDSATLFIFNGHTLYLKSKGETDGKKRPAASGSLDLFANSLLTVTYDTTAKTAVIYVNGVEMGRDVLNGNAFMLDSVIAALGYTGTARDGQERIYRSIRFYDRVLSASEIETNAFVDGFLRYQSDKQYVTDGLVSWYDGANHGTSDTVWEDLVGTNDITVGKGYSYSNNSALAFNSKGLYLKDTGVWLPDELRDVTLGEAFTMEFYVEDTANTGATWLGICTSAIRTTNANESMALYTEADGKLVLKSNGTSSNQRPTTEQSVMSYLSEGALVSVTYDTVAQAAVIYINGIEMARKPVTGAVLASSDYGIALGTITSGSAKKRAGQELTYRSVRFYNRALSETEIMQNAYADLACPTNITVAQPITNIVGDVAMTREIDSAEELSEMMAAESLPAAAIYRINSELFVTDSDGKAFARLFDVIKQTKFQVLPIVIPEDLDTVNTLAAFIKEIGFYDICILTKDAELLKTARTKLPTLRGALDLTDVYQDHTKLTKDDLINIRKVANTNYATVVLLPAALCTSENVQYLYNRQINTWMDISDTPTEVEKYNALLSGAVGVISDDTAGLLEIACALPKNTMTRTPLNGGHRGIPSKAPECTIESSILAYELGANYIEMDVHLSKDNEVVVCHDSSTNRTCDKNYTIANENYWGTLEYVKANKGYESDPLYKDCKLPLLDDYFEYFKNTDCLMVVEVKTGNAEIVPYIKALTEKYNMYDRVFVISFNANIRAAMRKQWPEMSVGYLVSGVMSEDNADRTAIDALKAFGSDSTSFNPQIKSLSNKAARAALLRGFQVNTWNSAFVDVANRFVSGLSSTCHNYADILGSAVQSFSANVPQNLLLGKQTALGMDLLTYANVDTGTTSGAQNVTVKVLEGADLVTVEGSTLTANTLGTVTFVLQYTYDYTDNNNVTQTISLCTQPITLTVVDARDLETAINSANSAKEGVVMNDGAACLVGEGKKYVTTAQMEALNDAIEAAEADMASALTEEDVSNAVKALTDALTAFGEAIQTGTAHSGVKQEGKAASCTEDGWKEYYQCSECETYFEEQACTTKIEDVPTWKTDAGKLAKHGTTTVAQQDATCAADGLLAYYTCSCGKYYSDEAKTTEITDLDAWKADAGKINMVDHDGEYDCSTICKYGCGTAITDAVEHDGEFACSKTCQYGCGTVMEDAVACVGEVPCTSTTCKYCGEAVTPVDCSGAHACSTKCQWCEEAVQPTADHTTPAACTDTKCSVCEEAVTPLGHEKAEGAAACSTKCKHCGKENMVRASAKHTVSKPCTDTKCAVCAESVTRAAHTGEYKCATVCQWCGTSVEPEKDHVKANSCDLICELCLEETKQVHEYDNECDANCNGCGLARDAGHKYDNDSDTTCNVCGEEKTADGSASGSESNNAGKNNEADTEGLSGGAIAGIVIAAVVVLGGGGFALFWFVIRKKKA